MTDRYSDLNQHAALYTAARKYPGGIEELAIEMDMTPAMVYNKLRPRVLSHYPSFEEVSKVIECLQEAEVPEADLPIQAFCWRHGYAAVKLGTGSSLANGGLLQMICSSMTKEGEVASAISSALSDDWISPEEQEKIELAIRAAVQGLLELGKRLQERRSAPRGGAK